MAVSPLDARRLEAAVAAAAAAGVEWDVLYVGRHALGRDESVGVAGLVRAGFSSCAHAYALSRRATAATLALLKRFVSGFISFAFCFENETKTKKSAGLLVSGFL